MYERTRFGTTPHSQKVVQDSDAYTHPAEHAQQDATLRTMALGTLILNAFSVRAAPCRLIRCRCNAVQNNVQTNTYDPRRHGATSSLLSCRRHQSRQSRGGRQNGWRTSWLTTPGSMQRSRSVRSSHFASSRRPTWRRRHSRSVATIKPRVRLQLARGATTGARPEDPALPLTAVPSRGQRRSRSRLRAARRPKSQARHARPQ